MCIYKKFAVARHNIDDDDVDFDTDDDFGDDE